MATTARAPLTAHAKTAHRTLRQGFETIPGRQESLRALLHDLMAPAARRLERAPAVRGVEDAATTITGAVRGDIHATGAQARAAWAVLGMAGELTLDAVARVRAAHRLRHRS